MKAGNDPVTPLSDVQHHGSPLGQGGSQGRAGVCIGAMGATSRAHLLGDARVDLIAL